MDELYQVKLNRIQKTIGCGQNLNSVKGINSYSLKKKKMLNGLGSPLGTVIYDCTLLLFKCFTMT